MNARVSIVCSRNQGIRTRTIDSNPFAIKGTHRRSGAGAAPSVVKIAKKTPRRSMTVRGHVSGTRLDSVRGCVVVEVESVANVSTVYSSDRQGCLNVEPCSKRSVGHEDAVWLTVHVQGRGFRGRGDGLLWNARAPSGSILASRVLCRSLHESPPFDQDSDSDSFAGITLREPNTRNHGPTTVGRLTP